MKANICIIGIANCNKESPSRISLREGLVQRSDCGTFVLEGPVSVYDSRPDNNKAARELKVAFDNNTKGRNSSTTAFHTLATNSQAKTHALGVLNPLFRGGNPSPQPSGLGYPDTLGSTTSIETSASPSREATSPPTSQDLEANGFYSDQSYTTMGHSAGYKGLKRKRPASAQNQETSIPSTDLEDPEILFGYHDNVDISHQSDGQGEPGSFYSR